MPSLDACNDKTEFKPLYSWDMPFKERIKLVAREVYGADGVDFSAEASASWPTSRNATTPTSLALHGEDAPVSLSDDPGVKGAPKGVEAAYPRRAHLRRRGLRGSGFRFHHAHARNGLNPSFRRVDVDVDTGRVKGSSNLREGGESLRAGFPPHFSSLFKVSKVLPAMGRRCVADIFFPPSCFL